MSKKTLKKVILISSVVLVALVMSGCSVPTDPETNKVIQITPDTTWKQTFDSENWFSAIFVWPLAQFLNFLTPKVGVAGAIAIVTLLVNAVLMIATLKSTIATQQMQLLQPELEKIQKKYEGKEDDASKQKQALEMQKLYQKYDVNPFSMLLVTFLQFPIIIAMYQAVQRASEIATGTFMGLDLQVTIWNGIKSGLWGYLAIFVVMGILQTLSSLLPQFLAKQRAKKEAEIHHKKPVETNSSQQKMMQVYMIVMILVVGLMWPAAMSIYWAIYSCVTILKTLITQKIIEDKKAKEKK